MKNSIHDFLILVIILILFGFSCAHKKELDKNSKFILEKKYGLAASYIDKGMPHLAQKELLDAISIEPGDKRLYTLLGQAYLKQNRFEQSLEALNSSLKIDKKNNNEAYFYKGQVYLLQRKWDEAILNYNKISLAAFFRAPHILYNSIGLAYYEKGEYDKAINNFTKALEFKYDFPLVHYNLGLAYHQKGETSASISEFENAIKFLDSYSDAYNQLALIYLKQGKKAKAKEMFTKVIHLSPKTELAEDAKKYLALME